MACVPCAIEMEPKTLKEGQINHAREQAVAIQKMGPQQASDIFVQGLRRVSSLGVMEQSTKEDDVDNEVSNVIIDQHTKDDEMNKKETTHHCLCTSLIIKSPDEVIEEPATAPF